MQYATIENLKELSEAINKNNKSARETYEKELAEVKKGNGGVAQFEEKLAKLDTEFKSEMKKLFDAVAQMEARSKLLSEKSGDQEKETKLQLKKSFFNWARKGDEPLTPEERKGLLSSNDAQGGYLAPTEFVAEIIKNIVVWSPVRSLARVRPTSFESSEFPKRTGTLTAAWVSEIGTRSETTGLTYGRENVPNHEMIALVPISNKNLEDAAFDMEAELSMEFGEQIGKAEATAFINGNGVGKPSGIITDITINNVAATGASNTLAADDFISALYALKQAYQSKAAWLLNLSMLAKVRKLKASGTGEYLMGPLTTQGPVPVILGRPVYEAPDLANDGTASNIPVLCGDFGRGYLISDRITVPILRDPFTLKKSGQVEFSARKRVGGQVIVPEAICKITA